MYHSDLAVSHRPRAGTVRVLPAVPALRASCVRGLASRSGGNDQGIKKAPPPKVEGRLWAEGQSAKTSRPQSTASSTASATGSTIRYQPGCLLESICSSVGVITRSKIGVRRMTSQSVTWFLGTTVRAMVPGWFVLSASQVLVKATSEARFCDTTSAPQGPPHSAIQRVPPEVSALAGTKSYCCTGFRL